MILNKLTLSKITRLTHDVHELIFVSEHDFDLIPGQFVTFILPSGLRRAYSVAYKRGKQVWFIVKKLEDGRGGSMEFCSLMPGQEICYSGPLGSFCMTQDESGKLLLGTGIGFSSLFCLIKSSLENGCRGKIRFIFGVRYKKDLFYELELKNLKNEYTNFDYLLYLSREDSFEYRKGYVSDFLTRENIAQFDEFYICGRTQMIQDSKIRLERFGVEKDRIFSEQY